MLRLSKYILVGSLLGLLSTQDPSGIISNFNVETDTERNQINFYAEQIPLKPEVHPIAAMLQVPRRLAEPPPFGAPCISTVPMMPAGCIPVGEPPSDEVAAVTINDFIAFSPAQASPTSEPANIGVRGLPMNFIASAAQHQRTGLLLGQPAAAEFTPLGYGWDFGDGQTLVTAASGSSWQSQGLREFDPTPTSHVYAERGTYDVTLVTYYGVRASYASDGVWWQVPGVLAIASDPMSVRIVTVNTVLVEKDCNEDPAGPGC